MARRGRVAGRPVNMRVSASEPPVNPISIRSLLQITRRNMGVTLGHVGYRAIDLGASKNPKLLGRHAPWRLAFGDHAHLKKRPSAYVIQVKVGRAEPDQRFDEAFSIKAFVLPTASRAC
jgi:hypothetical protein